MAIMTPTPRDQRELNLNSKIKLPRDRYTIRIKDEQFEFSKKGNPMIVLTPELVSPDTVTNHDGQSVNIAGVELKKMYFNLQVLDEETKKIDPVKSQKAFDRYSDIRANCGFPVPPEGIDVENPDKPFKGKLLSAICDSEEYSMRKDPTPEQRAKREPGDPILDENGKEIKGYSHICVSILGAANGETGGGF